MPSTAIRVSHLIDSGVRLSWREAIALIRGLAAVSSLDAAASSGTYDEFIITKSGEVATTDNRAVALSVSELALLLTRLLPDSTTDRRNLLPGAGPPAGLHFTIGRALGLTKAVPYETVARFAAALERFDRSDPALLLAGAAQCLAGKGGGKGVEAREGVKGRAGVEDKEGFGGGEGSGIRAPSKTADEPARRVVEEADAVRVAPPADRRRAGPRSETLRRLLRDEDRQNYLALADGGHEGGTGQRRTPGPSAEVLRQFLREADERNFALIRAVERMAEARLEQTLPGPGHAIVIALLILAAAVAGGRLRLTPRTPEPAAIVAAPPGPPVAALPDPQTAPTNLAPASAPVENSEQAIASAPVTHRAVVKRPPGRKAAPGVKQRAPVRRRQPAHVSPAPPVRRPVALRARPEVVTPTEQPMEFEVRAAAPVSPRTVGPPVVRAKRGPLPRFFGAVYRRLGNFVRGSDDMTE